MKKYLIRAKYTESGTAGLLKEGGTGRREALGNTLESLGGSLEALYYAFGSDDAILIANLPSDEAATAFSLQVNAAGVITVSLTVLLTPEQIDEASKIHLDYRKPGE